MTDWKAIEDGLAAWFKNALGKDDSNNGIPVRREDEGQVQPPGHFLGEMKVKAPQGVGVDFVEYEHDEALPDGEDFVPTGIGQRRFTVSFAVEAYDLRANWSAYRFAERVRTALWRPRSLETLRGLGLAVIRAESVQVVDGTVDGRRLGKAVLDVVFGAAVEDRDEEGAISWIEKTEVSSDLKDPAGDSLPSSLQLNDEVMP